MAPEASDSCTTSTYETVCPNFSMMQIRELRSWHTECIRVARQRQFPAGTPAKYGGTKGKQHHRKDHRNDKMIKFIKALAGFAALAFAGTAFADPIILSPDNCDTTAGGNCVTSNQVNQPSTEQFNTWLGEEGLEELYKDNFDGAEEGSFADDYSTNFFNTESDPSNATITWDGPDLIGCGVCYAWVKDGNSTPNIYIFDISNWNGKDDIAFQNFF